MDFASLVQARIQELGLKNINQAEDRFGFSRGYLRGVVRDDQKRAIPSIEKAQTICEAMGLEFYIGPPREPSTIVELDRERFALIPHYSPALLSDEGLLNLAVEADEHVAFPNDWFLRGRLKPDQCILFTALSSNMAPAICDGDLVMVDRKATVLRNGKAYAYQTQEDGFCLARLELVPERILIARSDNPDTEQFSPKYYSGNEIALVQAGILGEVIWSGHTWR